MCIIGPQIIWKFRQICLTYINPVNDLNQWSIIGFIFGKHINPGLSFLSLTVNKTINFRKIFLIG